MASLEEVEKVVERVGDLPAMPAVVSEVLRLTEDSTVDMAQVSAVIEEDPALAAKILQVSNSSYYGMKQFVGTLKLALVILGNREVRNVVLGISVFESLKDEGADMRVAQDIWNGSLSLAGLAKAIASAYKVNLQGEEFSAGLLANVGRMVILRDLQEGYREIYIKHRANPVQLCEAEVEEIGYTHADAATAMAIRWDLPLAIADALYIQYFHPKRPLAAATDPKLAAVVRMSRSVLSRPDFAEGVALALQEEEAWEILTKCGAPLDAGERQESLMEMAPVISRDADIPL